MAFAEEACALSERDSVEKRCVREWVEVFGFPRIKLLASRSSHALLFAALLQCLLPVTTPLVAMSVAYLGTFFVATACCSSHSTTCRQWTCMSAAAAVAIECGTPWAVCASLFLQVCPTWLLWWPPKKVLDLPRHGNIGELSDGTRWRVHTCFLAASFTKDQSVRLGRKPCQI